MKGILYTGGELDDLQAFSKLPDYLQAFLRKQNGVVAYFGGLHIRGCVVEPGWHSLHDAWLDDTALHHTYDLVLETDIPFAQDCVGNQFLLREDAVYFLDTETGELAGLDVDFEHFLIGAEKFPLDALGMEPLRSFQQRGGMLAPGQLLSVYPPVCIEATGQRSLKPLPAAERLANLAAFYTQIKGLPSGQRVHFTLKT